MKILQSICTENCKISPYFNLGSEAWMASDELGRRSGIEKAQFIFFNRQRITEWTFLLGLTVTKEL